jgi:hypothetical protein
MRIEKPVSQEEADKGGGFEPWPGGVYDFEVHEATDEVSKASGREQMKLALYVFNDTGQRRMVFDYLGTDEKSQWKVRHFCAAVGLIPEYERGEIDAFDCVGKQGKLTLMVRPQRGEYPASNSVRDYVAREEGAVKAVAPRPAAATSAAARKIAQSPVVAGSVDDDAIPF